MSNDHGHRFAVYSATGVHVGVWDDGLTAAKVLNDYPGGRVEELVTISYAHALVAEALEKAAERMDAGFSYNAGNRVRACTPADAKAALDALLRAEREKALREAVEVASSAHLKRAEGTVGGVMAQTRHNIASSILALVEKDKTDDTAL